MLRVSNSRDPLCIPHARGYHVQMALLQSSRIRPCHDCNRGLFGHPHRASVRTTGCAGLRTARRDDRSPHDQSQPDKSPALLPWPPLLRLALSCPLLVRLICIPKHRQCWWWNPQLDQHQERFLDQTVPDNWHRTLRHHNLRGRHGPSSWHLSGLDQGVGERGDEQPTEGECHDDQVLVAGRSPDLAEFTGALRVNSWEMIPSRQRPSRK